MANADGYDSRDTLIIASRRDNTGIAVRTRYSRVRIYRKLACVGLPLDDEGIAIFERMTEDQIMERRALMRYKYADWWTKPGEPDPFDQDPWNGETLEQVAARRESFDTRGGRIMNKFLTVDPNRV